MGSAEGGFEGEGGHCGRGLMTGQREGENGLVEPVPLTPIMRVSDTARLYCFFAMVAMVASTALPAPARMPSIMSLAAVVRAGGIFIAGAHRSSRYLMSAVRVSAKIRVRVSFGVRVRSSRYQILHVCG